MPTPLQMRNDELRRKRLMELMQAGQSRNMQDAQSQWDKEDFAETLRIGGTPDEKKYFDSLKMRGRAKQAEALLGGGTAESAVEWFPAANDANDYRGPMFRPNVPAPSGGDGAGGEDGMNPRLRNDLDIEQLKQTRLKTDADEVALRALRNATDPTERRREMMGAEEDMRRWAGVQPAPILSEQTPLDEAASKGITPMPPAAPRHLQNTARDLSELAKAVGGPPKPRALTYAVGGPSMAPGQVENIAQDNALAQLLGVKKKVAQFESTDPDWIRNQDLNAARAATVKSGVSPGSTPTVITSRPDPTTGNKIVPGTILSGNGVFQSGLSYLLEGKMPTLGMGGNAQIANTRGAIINTASAIADQLKVDVPSLRTEYATNVKTLGKMVPLYNQTVAYADSAIASMNFAEQSGEKVARSGVPTANKFINMWNRDFAGDKSLSAFETYVYTAARDYAKVTSGAALSVAELSVNAAKKADELLNSAQSPDQFAAALGAMKADMANVMDTQRAQIGNVSKTIGDLLDATNPPPITREDYAGRIAPQKDSTLPPQAGGQPRRKRYDMNGNEIR